jgi:hypothetical protein
MPGGKAPKRKGDKAELEIAAMFGGERSFWQPDERGDVVAIPYLGRAEVKRRKDFKTLYGWLAPVDALFMRGDRKDWLVLMRAEDLKKLLEELDELKREVG